MVVAKEEVEEGLGTEACSGPTVYGTWLEGCCPISIIYAVHVLRVFRFKTNSKNMKLMA